MKKILAWPWVWVFLGLFGASVVCQVMGLPGRVWIDVAFLACLVLALIAKSVDTIWEWPWGRVALVFLAASVVAYFAELSAVRVLAFGFAACSVFALITKMEYQK